MTSPTGAISASIVAATLQRHIHNGDILPGTQLSEQKWSQEMGVSRNTLREAFRMLVRDGLLTHRSHRGVFVHTPSADELEDIFRFREVVEPAALLRADAAELAPVLLAKAEFAQAAASQDNWLSVGALNSDFHALIVAAAGSETLNAQFSRVMTRARLAFLATDRWEETHRPFISRNLELAELINTGDLKRAAEALSEYLVCSKEMTVALLAGDLEILRAR